LENPNEETGQPERPYFELEPPAVSHQYQTLEIVGYHVPTLNERMSLMPHGEDGPPILPPRPNQKQFFQEQPFYWEPSQQTEVIYEELNKFKCREILLTDIKFTEEIGEGQFGSVWSGVWQLATGGKKIAIKVLKQSANEEEKAKFLREGARMMQFFHPNVVKLHGVCTLNNPVHLLVLFCALISLLSFQPLLIQELMGKGDLKSYLKHCRPNANNANPNKNSHPIPTPKLLLKFCRDIASGMKHLANKMFIHRDLAARNVLLNDNLICKIADFGLTRASSHFFDPSKSEQIPLRWTAPEAIHLRQYSEKSDVYSYGMTLFEIWSLGKKPFPKLNQTQEIIDFINQRRLLPPPPGCPRTIYHLMVKCWNPSPDGRLPFDTICNDYFSTNDEALLTWEDEDFEISQRAAEIGAPLSEGYHLYEELQHEYRYNQ
jgi:serine/threonine protein kinase